MKCGIIKNMKILSKIYLFFLCALSAGVAVFFTYRCVEAKHKVVVPVESFAEGVILAPDAGLNLLGRDEEMHRISSISKGEVVKILQLNGMNVATSSVNDEYYHCVYNNIDFWIYADYIAVNAVPALIIEKCDVFEEEACQGNPLATLNFASVIAASVPDEEKDVAAVFWYDSKEKKVLSGFTYLKNVSTYMDDVQVAAIIEKLRVTYRAVPRNELFKKAFSLNPSPKMKKILEGEQVEKIQYNYQDVIKALPGKRYQVNVGELNTVDQSKDPFKN